MTFKKPYERIGNHVAISSMEGFEVKTPSNYKIRVQGRLDAKYSDELGGMTITSASDGENLPVTTLVGHLVDQAALSGVLNTLYELHLPLLSVENLDEQV